MCPLHADSVVLIDLTYKNPAKLKSRVHYCFKVFLQVLCKTVCDT